jgi:hypothetical protein
MWKMFDIFASIIQREYDDLILLLHFKERFKDTRWKELNSWCDR